MDFNGKNFKKEKDWWLNGQNRSKNSEAVIKRATAKMLDFSMENGHGNSEKQPFLPKSVKLHIQIHINNNLMCFSPQKWCFATIFLPFFCLK
jgi:hypothetical protein